MRSQIGAGPRKIHPTNQTGHKIMARPLPYVSVRKMGTRAGQAHYGATCLGCPAIFGRHNVLTVAHLSKDAARDVGKAHTASDHGRASA